MYNLFFHMWSPVRQPQYSVQDINQKRTPIKENKSLILTPPGNHSLKIDDNACYQSHVHHMSVVPCVCEAPLCTVTTTVLWSADLCWN